MAADGSYYHGLRARSVSRLGTKLHVKEQRRQCDRSFVASIASFTTRSLLSVAGIVANKDDKNTRVLDLLAPSAIILAGISPTSGPLGSCPRADYLGDKFVPETYQLRAERTSSRGALPGSTGFSPMSGPFGGLAQMGVNPSRVTDWLMRSSSLSIYLHIDSN